MRSPNFMIIYPFESKRQSAKIAFRAVSQFWLTKRNYNANWVFRKAPSGLEQAVRESGEVFVQHRTIDKH